MWTIAQALCASWGLELWCSHLCSQHFTDGVMSPARGLLLTACLNGRTSLCSSLWTLLQWLSLIETPITQSEREHEKWFSLWNFKTVAIFIPRTQSNYLYLTLDQLSVAVPKNWNKSTWRRKDYLGSVFSVPGHLVLSHWACSEARLFDS